jgi:hypothetical protein
MGTIVIACIDVSYPGNWKLAQSGKEVVFGYMPRLGRITAISGL